MTSITGVSWKKLVEQSLGHYGSRQLSIMPMNPSDVLPGLPLQAKILFIRLRSLGDTILSIPLYTALKTWRPDLGISVLVEEPNDQVLANNPNIDHIISIPAANGSNWKDLRARLSALAEMRQSRFDCCINLHGGSTSAWLTALSGARYRVGYRRFRNAFAYNVSWARRQPNRLEENPYRGASNRMAQSFRPAKAEIPSVEGYSKP